QTRASVRLAAGGGGTLAQKSRRSKDSRLPGGHPPMAPIQRRNAARTFECRALDQAYIMNSRQPLDETQRQRRRQNQHQEVDISIQRKLVTFLLIDNRGRMKKIGPGRS